ncbi:MAG: response regulator, partial [Rubrivivax sp.]
MRLLLAEDDAILADALVAQFEHAGFQVEHAPNGAVADYLLAKQDFDAAVLDIGLPMVDGLTVLKNARVAKPALPVLVLTALDGLDDRVAGLNAGADDYLSKPFDFPELEARIRALLRRTRPLP